MLRVLVCEDSRTYAAALRRTLEHDGDIHVVAVFATAEQALAALPTLQPDLVTMDIELPGMNGLEAVEQIMGTRPTPTLVLSSYVGSETAAAALAAGALEVLAKDDLDLANPSGAAAAAFRRRVELLARARVIRHPRSRLRAPRVPAGAGDGRRAGAIGIVASTGGPQALATVLRALPASFKVPVLVVQHIAAGFVEGLARWLDGAVPLSARLAEEGAKLEPGIWVAPEGAHLKLGRAGRFALDRVGDSGLHRPSGDVLLTSLADRIGAASVAVVLSGMGRDGAAGAQKVLQAGGLAIAQDEKSSAVFGMPKAAVELGVDVVLSPAEIAETLAALQPDHGSGRG
jgi:two-component system, chemotaxis family, protein-glutamate methylesterase/glutaminase